MNTYNYLLIPKAPMNYRIIANVQVYLYGLILLFNPCMCFYDNDNTGCNAAMIFVQFILVPYQAH